MKSTDTFIPPRNKNDMTGVLKSLIRNKNIGVFIDSANLYYAANKAQLKIDYFQVARWFEAHCNLVTLNFYTAFDPLDSRQTDFFEDLEKANYTLIKKPIRVFADSIKGNMDIELAVDVLMNAKKIDSLVLISGDGDFQRLIQALDQLGKKTILLGVGGFTSYELHQEVDNYFFLNRIQEVWKKPRSRSRSKEVALPSKLLKTPQVESADPLIIPDNTSQHPITTESITSKPKLRPKIPPRHPKPSAESSNNKASSSTPVSTTPSLQPQQPRSTLRPRIPLRVKLNTDTSQDKSKPSPQIIPE